MTTRIDAPSGHIRPFKVHFIYSDCPSHLIVLAKSPCHAVQVMLRYFEIYYGTHSCLTYDRNLKECYVEPIFYFSDSLYKHLKTLGYGNY